MKLAPGFGFGFMVVVLLGAVWLLVQQNDPYDRRSRPRDYAPPPPVEHRNGCVTDRYRCYG